MEKPAVYGSDWKGSYSLTRAEAAEIIRESRRQKMDVFFDRDAEVTTIVAADIDATLEIRRAS
jgi:hypothetical protein